MLTWGFVALGQPVFAKSQPEGQAQSEGQSQPEGQGQGEESPNELFFEKVDVNLVNVEVFVTDRTGAPVTGLQESDFEVLEDGRPMKVTNFYAVDGTEPSPAPQPTTPTPTPPQAPERLKPVAAEPEDQRLHLVIYFDNLHLKPFSRNRVGRELRRFLRRTLKAEDRVMVVTYERNLHVRQGFTQDRGAVERALTEVEKLTGFATQKDAERTQVIRRMESSGSRSEAESHVDFYAQSAYKDVDLSIEGMKSLVGSLSGLPGRKALLCVSDGLPMEAAHDLFLLLDLKYRDESAGQLRSAQFSSRSEFRELVAQANSNRVTFYTLEALGLRSYASISAESGGTQDGGSRLDADFARDSNQLEPLQVMAEGTGGQAIFGTNNIAGALEKLGTDLKSFYSLGYRPSHSGDGRYHRIEVRLKGRKGVQVRHRNGYRDKTQDTRLAETTLAGLLHGVGNNPLGIEFQLESFERREDGFLQVPIEVRIPIGKLTLVPQEGQNLARMRVALAVASDASGTSPPSLESLTLTIPDRDMPMALEKHYVYAVQLLMRPGVQTVAVTLQDQLSGERSTVRRTVRLAK